MLKINREELKKRIKKEYPYAAEDYINQVADKVLQSDKLFEKNIQEWILEQPLSDIKIDEYSIKSIVDKKAKYDFLKALEVMNIYLKDPKIGKVLILRNSYL